MQANCITNYRNGTQGLRISLARSKLKYMEAAFKPKYKIISHKAFSMFYCVSAMKKTRVEAG